MTPEHENGPSEHVEVGNGIVDLLGGIGLGLIVLGLFVWTLVDRMAIGP